MAVLLEFRAPNRLEMTASMGIELPSVEIELGGEPSGAATAFTTGRRYFVPNARADPAVSARLLDALGLESVLFEPVLNEERVVGVLTVGWERGRSSLERQTGLALGLFAVEAGLAIERADMLRRLQQLAATDQLTGLPNRRSWEIELPRELSRSERTGEPICAAVIDIDRFKLFNDTHGHQAGDLLLKECASAWRGQLRTADTIARIGGEEFAMLLPGCELDQARGVLERVRDATPREVTCSIGFAPWSPEEPAKQLLARADAALYEAKRGGRDAVVAEPSPNPGIPGEVRSESAGTEGLR